MIDAQHVSRMFEVQSGGVLRLEKIQLANANSIGAGGTFLIRAAAVDLVDCDVINSTSVGSGGVAAVLNSRFTVLGGTIYRERAYT